MGQTTSIEIRFNYPKGDTEFKQDYTRVDIFINNEWIRCYGDYHHDRGGVQAESYVQGYVRGSNSGDIKVIRTKIAKV